jgi:hypothetical protein
MTEHRTGLKASATARVIKAADAAQTQQQPETPAGEGDSDGR